MTEPLDRVEWVDASTLSANHWNPNRVATPELRLLEFSILSTGWVQPVLVSRAGTIIDGFHRWALSSDKATKVFAKYGGRLPVVRLDVDEAQAMLLTVRMNRAKGTHVAVLMHELVTACVEEHGLTRAQVAEGIGATVREVDLLLQASVFKVKGLDDYRYGEAWVPFETDVHGPPSERDRALMLVQGQEQVEGGDDDAP